MKKKLHVAVQAALITSAAIVVAALIGAFLKFLGPSGSTVNTGRDYEGINVSDGDYVVGDKLIVNVYKSNKEQLDKKYPGGYFLFKVDPEGLVAPPKGLIPPGFEIKWSTAQVLAFTDKNVTIKVPDMIINTNHVKEARLTGNKVTIPKNLNAKMPMVSTSDFRILIEVIYAADSVAIVGIGVIPQD